MINPVPFNQGILKHVALAPQKTNNVNTVQMFLKIKFNGCETANSMKKGQNHKISYQLQLSRCTVVGGVVSSV